MSIDDKLTPFVVESMIEHLNRCIVDFDNAILSIKVIPKERRDEKTENLLAYYRHAKGAMKYAISKARQRERKQSYGIRG